MFYKDWWNCTSLYSYWRLWNLPVHAWCVRHIYLPLKRKGWSRTWASFVVFFVSAVAHEMLLSIPLRMFKLYAFWGMMLNMPGAIATAIINKRYPGSQWGNAIFWISFCIFGQPLAVFLYVSAAMNEAS